mmetsp:Transcript_4215/g.13405  ORF Transcript_4215/g.13405 Transcript_4215/m.13405 type:complete len:332 (-) Transcript_4215:807-1802(-)
MGAWGSGRPPSPMRPAVTSLAASSSSPASVSSQWMASASWVRRISHVTPRRSQILRTEATMSSTAEKRTLSSRERMSTVKFALPAITLLAPGQMLASPTVQTSMSSGPKSLCTRASCSAVHSRPYPSGPAAGPAAAEPAPDPAPPPPGMHRVSTKWMASAAAARGSRRWFMGTVPACPCVPSTLTRRRVWPAIAETTPSGMPRASSCGPCSMCTSTYPRTLSDDMAIFIMFSSEASDPIAAITSAMDFPSLSVLLSMPCLTRVPAMARLPRKVEEKRSPSSSEKATTSMWCFSAERPSEDISSSRKMVFTAAMPVMIPRAPSYFPASITVS